MTSPTQSAMEQQQREDLHARIMNLPCKFAEAWSKPEPSAWIQGYVNGHRDARHAAAELAAEHASELRSLRDSLALARSHIGELREALERAESAMTYSAATLSPGNRHGVYGEWVGVHGGRAGSSYSQMRDAIDAARAALNKEQP